MKLMTKHISILLLMSFNAILTNETSMPKEKKRALGLFNVIKFANVECNGEGDFNGTCYTSDECRGKGGNSERSCASGYGVCCTFKPGCGTSSSENTTYLISSKLKLTPPTSCSYKICPKSKNICRIRLDFHTFEIAAPVTFSTTTTGLGGSLGDCITDSFSVTSPDSIGSPVICGINTNQHMILDVSSQCLDANFVIKSTTADWNIKVTQYQCGHVSSGPHGCLQYFTGTTGIISSFNFPTSSLKITSTAQHLSNQNYEICLRRESQFCSICFVPNINLVIDMSTIDNQNSFGLSNSNGVQAAAQVNSLCSSDYITIPGGGDLSSNIPMTSRNCGRFLSTVDGDAQTNSVCTKLAPFRLSFVTDGNEETVGSDSSKNELQGSPFGTIGFSLKFTQNKC